MSSAIRTKLVLFRQFYSSINRSSVFKKNRIISHQAHKNLFKTICMSYSSVQDFSSVVKETGFSSRYHPLSPLDATEERMRDKFFQKKSFTYKEWDNIRRELMTNFLILNESNFDSVLMNVLLYTNNYPLAYSFMEYLKHIKRSPNFVTCLRYMNLCSKNMDVCKPEMVLETFRKIKHYLDESPVLDSSTVDSVIQGLCATELWQDSFTYLEKLVENNPKLETKNALTCAALRNDNTELAWDMLENWYTLPEQPANRVFKQYMKLCLKEILSDFEESEVMVERLFKYLIYKNIVIKSSLAEDIFKYFDRSKRTWKIQKTQISRSGVCSGCGKTLEATMLTEKDFSALRDAFYQKSVKKIDIFINTTENELKYFLNFVERNKPFDLVLDGLNAAHHATDGIKTRKSLGTQLLKVIRQLSVRYHRILILGRKHMRNWPPYIWEQIRKHALVFFASDISEDDPFMIYATLSSGPNTVFLSSDLMRDHASKLGDPVLINLFKHWQLSHQIYLSTNENGELSYTKPLKHHIQIQGNMETGWHIPFDDEFILEPYEELNNWLCVQPSKSLHRKINS